MVTIYQKAFMSGNSVAVRLPRSLGIDAGADLEISQDENGIHIRPRQRRIDVSGFAGKLPGFMVQGREPVDDPVREWGAAGNRE